MGPNSPRAPSNCATTRRAENRIFDPETAHLLAAALENAWKSLTTRGDRFADPLKAAHSREVLAKRIIELAQHGERDSTRLCDDALAYPRSLGALITGGASWVRY